jgi:hypothetical protein
LAWATFKDSLASSWASVHNVLNAAALACETFSGTDTTAAVAETICDRRHSLITAEASFIEVFDSFRTASTVGSSFRPDCSNNWPAAAKMRSRISGLTSMRFSPGV